MTVTVNGTTGVSLVQDSTITSAKIVDGTIAPADLSGAQTGSAPIYGCRAWCIFDGTASGTITPLAGGNVTNITKNATGDYTINFTTAMQDANYSVQAFAGGNTGAGRPFVSQSSAGNTYTSSALRILVGDNGGLYDCLKISISIFR